MARNTEALKIQPWARDGDRTDPDNLALVPPLNRLEGWPDSYSQPDGNPLRRQVFNQILHEITAMLHELNQHGLLEWHAEIRYSHPAAVMGSNGLFYSSVQDSLNQDPTADASNTYWKPALAALGVADIPDLPASKITEGTFEDDLLPVVPIEKGGTGSNNASSARGALGLGSAATKAFGTSQGQLVELGEGGVVAAAQVPKVPDLNGVTVSTAEPSGSASEGDLWIQREA